MIDAVGSAAGRADDGPGPRAAGLAHLGVPRAGAAGPAGRRRWRTGWSATPDAAVLEVTCGGLVLTSDAGVWVAVTGAPMPVEVDGVGAWLRPGGVGARWWPAPARPADRRAVLRRGRGRRRRRPGARLAVDRHAGLGRAAAGRATAPSSRSVRREVRPRRWTRRGRRVRARYGSRPGRARTGSPRTALDRLCAAPYAVEPESNRVGLASRGEPPASGAATTSCRARGWCSAPSRCRRTASRWCSSPTTRRPAATRCSAVVHPDDLWQCGQLPGRASRCGSSEVLDALRGDLDRLEAHLLVDRDHVVVGLGVLGGDQREVGARAPARRGG